MHSFAMVIGHSQIIRERVLDHAVVVWYDEQDSWWFQNLLDLLLGIATSWFRICF